MGARAAQAEYEHMIAFLFRLLSYFVIREPDEALVIKPPIVKYVGADEGLRDRTAKKREAADKIRSRANKVETGSPVADVLRRVG